MILSLRLALERFNLVCKRGERIGDTRDVLGRALAVARELEKLELKAQNSLLRGQFVRNAPEYDRTLWGWIRGLAHASSPFRSEWILEGRKGLPKLRSGIVATKRRARSSIAAPEENTIRLAVSGETLLSLS